MDGVFVTTEKSILDQSKEKVKQVAIKTGVKPWHVVAAIIFLICLVLGLCGWCTWRFLRKKRIKDGKKKDLGAEAMDEEEIGVKEEPIKALSKEYLGKLQYKLEYDFNT